MSNFKTPKKSFSTLVLMIFLLSLNFVPAQADDFHYRNQAIGERASGLGGAYTAISDSPAGSFYNPAGIVYLPGSSLSASVNAYNYSTKSYKDTLTKTDGSTIDYEQTSSVLLPNFFGMVSNFGPVKLGFSYAVPDAIQRKQKQSFANIQSAIPGKSITNYTININDIDNVYKFGPSLATSINDRWSIGATLYAHYREATVIRNQLLELSSGEFEWTNQYQNRTDWGVQPKIGVMGELADKLTLGLTVSRLWITSSKIREQTTYRGISSSPGFSDPDLVNFGIINTDEKADYPWVTTLGLAWFASPALLMSADASYYTKVNGDSPKEATFNVAAGAEYYIFDSLALRGGLFTDLANTPELKDGRINQAEHINLYGGSLSITRFTRSSSTTLGVSYARGSGEAQIKANNPNIQDVVMNNLALFLSASYSF